MKILIMDDNTLQNQHVAAAAAACGYACDIAEDGQSGWAMLATGAYDLAIIDCEMPRLGGLDVVRKARQRGVRTYLIILSSHNSEADRIAGLSMGADDYLGKPIPIDELSLRMKAIARRLQPQAERETLSGAGIVMDMETQTVRRAGKVVDLTPREKKLLTLFLRNKGRCLTYGAIADHVWGSGCDAGSSVVTANVCRLRKKLNAESLDEVIHTVRDVGYVFK
ncbi:MAG: response regulator transcription factor [Kiritimatiellia bacterium]|mgnify:CR=1 FL=1